MSRRFSLLLIIIIALILVSSANGALGSTDLNGDGFVNSGDFIIFRGSYGKSISSPDFNPVSDFDQDGDVDGKDFNTFRGAFGTSSDPDTDSPGLFITLNDIPDDMNDLLVVPPDGFIITLSFDYEGGSSIDTNSVVVTCDKPIGATPAGSPLPFSVYPTRATYEIPPGTELDRSSHFLTVSVSDVAGNETSDIYGFAVRDFDNGAPLGNPQNLFLDFSQDRSLTPEIDFIEDLRTYGLSDASNASTEAIMWDRVVAAIVEGVRSVYGLEADGQPGPDAVNISITEQLPGAPHARLCVGGESFSGSQYLGGSTVDMNNRFETEDECQGAGAVFGVFPQAIDDLWGGSSGFHAVFDPILPGVGTPVGTDPLDDIVLAAGFVPGNGSQAERDRYDEIVLATETFAAIVATATAHETGHLLGLTAPGPTPGGLYGALDHNDTPAGGSPSENYIMNYGGTFSFEEISGYGGDALPVFRTLNWAYLRDRIVLDASVTDLIDGPSITSVSPNPLNTDAWLTVTGANFEATPTIHLLIEGDPTPNLLLGLTFVDSETVMGYVKSSSNPPGLYDVMVTNPDGQSVTLIDALLVQ